MKLSNWVAIIGCVGLGIGAAVGAQGCTATLTIGPCDGGNCGIQNEPDSGTPANEDSGTVIVNDSGTPADSGSPDATQATDAGATCNSCVYAQCVSQFAGCLADNTPTTGCLAIYQCATSAACAVDGGNCVQDCYDQGSVAGKALYIQLGDCNQSAQCVGASPTGMCGALCNATADTCAVEQLDGGEDAAVVDGGACNACLATNCSAQVAACQPGTACATYNQCLLGCTTQTCDNTCASTDDAGASAATALGTCTSTSCTAQCLQ